MRKELPCQRKHLSGLDCRQRAWRLLAAPEYERAPSWLFTLNADDRFDLKRPSAGTAGHNMEKFSAKCCE